MNVIGISDDGDRVISAADFTVRVWDVGMDKRKGVNDAYSRAVVTCAEVSEDGRWLVYGSNDGWVFLRDMKSGGMVGRVAQDN
ncbi:hypothetical protein BWQ96_03239 [Gracilariopsis chorda]|uniref:Uncharacterized protein n=1 Tax=Gracilariopsis chorda TaxID=448386 RepID=A0A2V3IXR0_9FLOR|nr:hypothetical protein BWQ96_03239 [Gracilariopsis chorda]|eukprot:PXF46901.1 hypothetical protein BWQ96_03239 [Gracilariopsis chorda]